MKNHAYCILLCCKIIQLKWWIPVFWNNYCM